MSDRVAVFDDGIIQQLAPPDDLYERPDNSFVAQFIGENNKLTGTVSVAVRRCRECQLADGETCQALAVKCGDVGSRDADLDPPRTGRIGAVARM